MIILIINVEIVKSVVVGVDLFIIVIDVDRVGREFVERFFNEFGEMVGYIERMKFLFGYDFEYVDVELVRKEFKNILVRVGFKSF